MHKTLILFTVFLCLLVKTACCNPEPYKKLTAATDLSTNPHVQCLWMPSKNAKSSVLIAHGFNVRPEKMSGLIDYYHNQGADVLLSILEGHHKKSFDIQNLSGTWYEQIEHCAFQMKKEKPHSSLTFVGFSLGGLLGARLAQEHHHLFHNMELLAPAIAIRQLPKLAKYMWESFHFPTFGEFGYTIHSSIAARSYHTILNLQDEFLGNLQKLEHSETHIQIYLHPSDPLISWSKINTLIKQPGLAHWEVYDIRKLGHKKISTKSIIKHMIIDEKTLGEENWGYLKRKFQTHLLRSQSSL
ncbi:MAG: alpha/beta hydrolase [Oligoflexales bacterium]